MKSGFCAFLLTAIAASVDAHGFLYTVTIDGKRYVGNVPGGSANPSVIRQVSDISPVKGASNPDLNCGLSAQLASLVADANPGSAMAFNWSGGDFQHWPHNTGPMLTYMASCGSTPCNQFNSANAKWFKIQQIARNSNGNWAQADIMAGAQADVTIPSTLAPGNYIIRHEIISLQNAVAEGGAEFYPACTQLNVGGSQTGAPTADELVSFPGAYSDTDPGIFDPSVYDTSGVYVFPGPPIAAFVGTSASSGGVQGSGSGTTPSMPTSSSAGNGSETVPSVPTSSSAGNGSESVPTPSSSAYSAPMSTPTCNLKRNLATVKKDRSVSTRSTIVRRGHRLSNLLKSLFSGYHRRS